jgi:hypothetical protein
VQVTVRFVGYPAQPAVSGTGAPLRKRTLAG